LAADSLIRGEVKRNEVTLSPFLESSISKFYVATLLAPEESGKSIQNMIDAYYNVREVQHPACARKYLN
jgi:hypothetical protein